MLRFAAALAGLGGSVTAATPAAPLDTFTFASIDGGELNLGDYTGQVILVVNTASECGFTRQYNGLQDVSDRYGDQGLTVISVPSDDFNQEFDSAAEVKDFCEINYNLTLPMTEITSVRGENAHPFYAWMRDTHGFKPRWNFNKVLIGRDGQLIDTFGATVVPNGRSMIKALESALAE
ncbi:MAG: glutathione peroxidase [Marinovum sp.]|nr:glutathione peroxidase [Marinovum sp.]